MADIQQTAFWNTLFWKNFLHLLRVRIDRGLALVQGMAFMEQLTSPTGEKSLPEPMMTQSTDVYMHPWASMS